MPQGWHLRGIQRQSQRKLSAPTAESLRHLGALPRGCLYLVRAQQEQDSRHKNGIPRLEK